ncbi:MAG: LacI family DNA-binding transcriptional regulator [Rhodobacteraceae bacterium]|nr:LacI family DNA-binding transcriptional regulator [Paracoccaceae bacterium]
MTFEPTDKPKPSAPAKERVTLRDVADSVGVSISTASRALSGASGISTKVRKRVQEAATALDYSGATKPHTIVVAIDVRAIEGGAGEFTQAVQRGIEHESRLLGLNLSFQHVLLKAAPLSELDGKADGYILLSLQAEHVVEQFSASGVAAVIVNGREPLMRLDAVAPANRAGGYLGTKHLIGLGHRKILFLDHSKRPTIRDRMLGNHKALEQAGLALDPTMSIELPEMRADIAYQKVSARLEQNGRPDFTAIQCCNDAAALGAIAALSEHGLKVPGDISVLGFDDVPAAALNSTPLSTLHVDTFDLGARSVRRLVERIQHPDQLVTYTETAVSLIARQSTGPVAG